MKSELVEVGPTRAMPVELDSGEFIVDVDHNGGVLRLMLGLDVYPDHVKIGTRLGVRADTGRAYPMPGIATPRDPERVTVKDLRVGDRARFYAHGDRFVVVGECVGDERLVRFDVDTFDMLICGMSREVEVISRADQFASGMKAAGVVIGRALSASVPRPDGTSLVTVAFGDAAAREWDYCRGCDDGLCVSSGSIVAGRLFCGGCAAEERAILAAEERAANPMVTVNAHLPRLDAEAHERIAKAVEASRYFAAPLPLLTVTVEEPPDERLDAAREMDALMGGSSRRFEEDMIAQLSPAPRCPSCDSAAHLRKTDHGWYCGGTCGGWHGASLTAPPAAARHKVGDWVRLMDPLLGLAMGLTPGQSAAAYQVMEVRREDGEVAYRIAREPGAKRVVRESQIEACEAPR